MKQLIDKSAVVAEIERRISVLKANESVIPMLTGGMFVNEFKDLLSFIGSLETKEVDEDTISKWRSADGNYLPEIDREVVVFTQDFPNDAGIMKVTIAHRPNPNGWDGRNILTGEVNHYTPKTYDKGGWNIPDVRWWLDLDLPMEE